MNTPYLNWPRAELKKMSIPRDDLIALLQQLPADALLLTFAGDLAAARLQADGSWDYIGFIRLEDRQVVQEAGAHEPPAPKKKRGA